MSDHDEAFEEVDVNDLMDPGAPDDATEAPNRERGDLVEPDAPRDPPADPATVAPDPADAATAAPEATTEAPVTPPAMIPKARFDAVNNDRKALRDSNRELTQRIEAYERSQASSPASTLDLREAEARWGELMLEGRSEEALELRMQINTAITEQVQARSLAQQSQLLLHEVAESLLDQYPQLSEQAALLDDVCALRDGYVQQGLNPARALQKAASTLLGRAPPSAEPPSADLATQRRQQALTKSLAAAEAQPPSLADAGVSARQARTDLGSLSEAGFRKLSEDDKARARGDFL